MPREIRSVRFGEPGLSRLDRMAGVMSGDEVKTGLFGAVVRTLVREALATREQDCRRGHQGPIKGGACGHCGKEVAS